jgi:hypothetical protein
VQSGIFRLAGIAAILFGLALIVDLASDLAVSTSKDDIAAVLSDVQGHRAIFLFHEVWRMADVVVFVPVLLGLFFTLRADDRPYTVLVSVFFVAGSTLVVVSHAVETTLRNVAADLALASSTAGDPLLRDGDLLRETARILDGAAIGALAVAIFVTGLLVLRSRFYAHWLGWLAAALGLLALPGFLSFYKSGFALFWLAVFIGQIVWLFGVGMTMWQKAEQAGAEGGG